MKEEIKEIEIGGDPPMLELNTPYKFKLKPDTYTVENNKDGYFVAIFIKLLDVKPVIVWPKHKPKGF